MMIEFNVQMTEAFQVEFSQKKLFIHTFEVYFKDTPLRNYYKTVYFNIKLV